MSAVLKSKSDKVRDLTVLIVDDNPGDRALYRHLLEESDPGTDYTFFEAATGQEALQIVDSEPVNCMLLDYLLPDMVGLDLLNQALRRMPAFSVPVVMLTGFGDETTAVSALQSGAQGYIPKRDLTGESLAKAINHALKFTRDKKLQEQSNEDMASKNKELESKYVQIDTFYKKILGKLKKPVTKLREDFDLLVGNQSKFIDQESKKQISDLRGDIESLVTTLNNLVNNPGLNVGKLLISTRPESVLDVVFNSITGFRTMADAKDVFLAVRIQPGLPEVQMDRYRIEQVLANLLDNSIRFTPSKGRISLNVDRLPASYDVITISVIDTGEGIDPGRIEHIFDHKTPDLSDQADGKTGLGLGLHLCKEIIKSHQGSISIRNMPEGGTCTTFTLPIEPEAVPIAQGWQQESRRNDSHLWRLHA